MFNVDLEQKCLDLRTFLIALERDLERQAVSVPDFDREYAPVRNVTNVKQGFACLSVEQVFITTMCVRR